ncbi:Cysteine-rich transmembrane CYSTM domain [Arabidopsis thaliana x Arabidopsis arenosa]|nr:cysteine-rich/transmembrane domain A-like protein [Arabidopsis thaliana]ANM61463.1 cysteine-rich/transmembrane domain A-like protein [Arabidopsis thaliana]KAG7638191.1 Cysteine-rich transmembrane CYSTM domain [Arabidopsis thaliana x Arabidopsis arenosa]|eukprot:NP_001323680.1 cysteine-rich/transmembrane domain A-like protein [Arabidopsis thaliana]
MTIYLRLQISIHISYTSTYHFHLHFQRKIIICSNMSQYSQNQYAGAYPTPPVSTGPYVAPPPLGYPTNDTTHATVAPVETKSKGEAADGFLKGCLATMLACCVLDACIF